MILLPIHLWAGYLSIVYIVLSVCLLLLTKPLSPVLSPLPNSPVVFFLLSLISSSSSSSCTSAPASVKQSQMHKAPHCLALNSKMYWISMLFFCTLLISHKQPVSLACSRLSVLLQNVSFKSCGSSVARLDGKL